MEAPLELVRFDQQTNKFVVGRQALEALRYVRSPIGVVAVCGRARQGKSYILNQLLGRSSGFKVSPTQRPCTKGLWMWSKPIRKRAPDGSEYHLVLLDSEGIDAYDQTAQYSTQIFALAVLLSSLFVYNQMGGIDEAALDKLSLVTEMTNVIRVRSQGSADRDLGGFTPAFLWLLRDFYLELEEDGRKITPKDYLEQALLPTMGSGPGAEMKNKIRSSIKSLFPQRDCFTLVRPVNDERQLQNLESMPQSHLRQEFTQGMRRLTDLIFARAVPKYVSHQVITGPALAGLAEAYVKAINDGAVPTIVTAWQAVADAECRKASDMAEAHYAAVFNTNVSPEEGELAAEHQRALAEARKVFSDNAIGDEDMKRAHQARFEENVKLRFSHFHDKKIAEANAAIDRMLYEANTHFQKLVRGGPMDANKFQSQVKAFVQDYASRTTGPTKWRRMADFVMEAYALFAGALEQRLKKELDEKGLEIERTASSAKQAAEKVALAEQRAKAAEERLRQDLSGLQSSKEQALRRAEDVQRQLSELQLKSASTTAAQEQLQREAKTLRDQIGHKDRELQSVLADLEREKRVCAQSSERAREASSQLETAKMKTEQGELALRNQMEAMRQEALAAREEWREREQEILSQRSLQDAEVSSARQQATLLGQELDQTKQRACTLERDLQSALAAQGLADQEQRSAADQLSQASQQLTEQRAENLKLQGDWTKLQENLGSERKLRQSAEQEIAKLKERLIEMEIEARRAVEGDLTSPQDTTVQLEQPTTPVPESETAADTVNPAEMTVKKIKAWLLAQGHGGDIWDLEQQRPAPKKADWVALMERTRNGHHNS